MNSVFQRAARRTILAATALVVPLFAQTPAPTPPTPLAALTLQDALTRARQYSGQIQSAALNTALAREDTKQARALALPTVNALNQFIYTQGNGTPSGVFVANDGVHVYNEQAVAHEELLSVFRHGEVRRALAAEAVARAKTDVAGRGLTVTVAQDYYAILAAQHKYANAQQSLKEAQQFLDITQKQEAGGEAAHADVIKAQINVQQRQRDLQDADLAAEKSRIALGVLIFPDYRSEFNVADDLATPVLLAPLPESQAKATASSPDLAAARASITQSSEEVNVARYAYLPSFGIDFFYGIDANQFTNRTNYPTPESGRSTLPNYEVSDRQNLGYSFQATLIIPLWNWGTTRSKIRQAALKEEQAHLDLSVAQRTLTGTMNSAHREAEIALSQVDSLKQSVDLSAEGLRLTVLRYQAGEATAFEVSDAQSTLAQARNAYDDGLVRYKVALATLATLTGTL
jgi:outer membrane protein TolC